MRTLTALLAAGVSLLAPAAAHAAPTQSSIFEDDSRLLYSGSDIRTQTLDALHELGVDTIRVPLTWNHVAPSPGSRSVPHFDSTNPAAYPAAGWDAYDEVVRGAAARHMTVLLTVTGPAPEWAEGCHVKGRPGICKPSARQFAGFVHAVGTRYSGHYADENGGGTLPRVTRWSIWNEPNLYKWLYPQLVRHKGHTVNWAAARYRSLFRGAAAALLRTGHARDAILLGETSPVGSTGHRLATRTTSPVTFVRAVMCLDSHGHPLRGRTARAAYCGGKFHRLPATGVAHHPYTPAASCTPRCRGGSADATIASLGRMVAAMDQGARYGRIRHGLPLYLTEFGFQSNPPNKYAGVSLSRQAKFINWADYIAFRSSRVRSVAQYELYDDTRPGAFQTGLVRSTGQRKPSWAAYRMPIFVVRSGRTHVGVFGQVRPAGSRHVLIQRKASRRARWHTVARVTIHNHEGYLYRRVHRHGGYWRLAWTASARARTAYSRTAGVG